MEGRPQARNGKTDRIYGAQHLASRYDPPTITLTSHDQTRRKTTLIDFIVIRHPTEHNIILGRTTIFRFWAISFNIHGIVKFSTIEGPRTILVTPSKELRFYENMQPKEIMKEAKKPRSELSEEGVIINVEYPDQPVSIGVHLPPTIRQELIELLKKYKHVFAWTPTYMVGVDRKVIEHKLMIKPGTNVVK